MPDMRHSAKHIADRIRLMITTKQFQVGEALPSTRELGKQLQASFHTVRKAYQALEQEGLIEGLPGKGFLVRRQTTRLDKSQRLEEGAERMRLLIEELIGHGLDEAEIETVFQEQLHMQEWPDRIQSVVSVAETEELARMLSEAIRREVGVRSDWVSMAAMDPGSGEGIGYDAMFVPMHLYGTYRPLADRIRVMPIVFTFDPDALILLSERLSGDSIGLVTSDEATIPVLLASLRSSVQLGGSFVAGATYGKSLPLFVRDVDLVVYTDGAGKLVESRVPESRRLPLGYVLSEKSLEAVRSELWE